jgi:S1-C subfamily serine protease
VVTSLYMVDPTVAQDAPEEEGVKYSINVTSAKMIVADGKEIPVKMVLRDKDLDLAVFKPEAAPAQPMAFVDLTHPVEAQVLDPLLVLLRMDKVAGRSASAGLVRINAAPKKPRPYYVVGQADQMIGALAFTVKGEAVGLVTLRWTEIGEDESLSMFGAGSMSEIPVVLPASDVMEVVAQAKEGKSEPAAPAAPAPEKAPAV